LHIKRLSMQFSLQYETNTKHFSENSTYTYLDTKSEPYILLYRYHTDIVKIIFIYFKSIVQFQQIGCNLL